MTTGGSVLLQASAVAIAGRALLIEGAPGSGKSSLVLALLDRGAQLIGDDGVSLRREGGRVFASPPPRISGKLEVHGVGIFERETVGSVPLALILSLGADVERLPETIPIREILDLAIPAMAFDPGDIAPAIRAELALERHGLASE